MKVGTLIKYCIIGTSTCYLTYWMCDALTDAGFWGHIKHTYNVVKKAAETGYVSDPKVYRSYKYIFEKAGIKGPTENNDYKIGF